MEDIDCDSRKLKVDEIKYKHIIDCDVRPFVPKGMELYRHRECGKIDWNPDDIELYFCDEQKKGSIGSYDMRKKLEDKLVLNACVLDYLLAHQELIPEDWEDMVMINVFFWGTIYSRSWVEAIDLTTGYNLWTTQLYVRYLSHGFGYWKSHYQDLYGSWGKRDPAAILFTSVAGK